MGEGALGLGTMGYVGVAVLMISALLTAGYLLPIVADAFFPGEDYEYNDEASLTRLPVKMKLPLLLLSAGAILSGIFAGWLAAGIL